MDQILDVAKRFSSAMEAAGLNDRIVGGLAAFLHVETRDPLAARLTRDVDAAVHRADLEQMKAALEPYGFVFRHAAGVDMFLDAQSPSARSAVHVIFAEAVPMSPPVRATNGILIVSVEDLLRMKPTSFRLKDKVHVQDLDSVGLITAEVEASLSEVLRRRLAEVRSTE